MSQFFLLDSKGLKYSWEKKNCDMCFQEIPTCWCFFSVGFQIVCRRSSRTRPISRLWTTTDPSFLPLLIRFFILLFFIHSYTILYYTCQPLCAAMLVFSTMSHDQRAKVHACMLADTIIKWINAVYRSKWSCGQQPQCPTQLESMMGLETLRCSQQNTTKTFICYLVLLHPCKNPVFRESWMILPKRSMRDISKNRFSDFFFFLDLIEYSCEKFLQLTNRFLCFRKMSKYFFFFSLSLFALI